MDSGSTRDSTQNVVKTEVILPSRTPSPSQTPIWISVDWGRTGQIHFRRPGLFSVIIALLAVGVAFATAFALLVGLLLIGILAAGGALAAFIHTFWVSKSKPPRTSTGAH
jgi:hypothetical protein